MSDPQSSHETWLSKLRDRLRDERYALGGARRCIAEARSFMAYLEKRRIEIGAVQPKNVEQYLQHARRLYRRRHGHFPEYKSWRGTQTNGIHMLLRLVLGQWPPAPTGGTQADVFARERCQEFVRWMTSFSGLATLTMAHRCDEARRFLEWLGDRASQEELASLRVRDVDAYMMDRARLLRRTSLKGVATRMRGLLRWLHLTGQTTHDLSVTAIAPSLYAFEGIPSALRAQDVTKVLAVTSRDCTPKGIRDYAILVLLAKYGLRAGEVTALRLDDVDWRKEVIRIRHTKSGGTSFLPLLPEVGDAVLNYLQKSRPQTSIREMFIRCRAPYRPFRNGSSLYGLVQLRFGLAGLIITGKRGPHAFRHARAVSLLRAAVPVKEIGDLLGHRAADSTLVYLKLATEDLRAVALEIPVGARS